MGIEAHVYSVSRRIEYIPIEKCASSSIQAALLASDSIDIDFRKARQRWRGKLPFRPIGRFTFIRDPIHRIFSSYREKYLTGYWRRLRPRLRISNRANINGWIDHITRQDKSRLNGHYAPQVTVLRRRCNPATLTFVGCVERFNDDWLELCEIHGVEMDLPPHLNQMPVETPELSEASYRKMMSYFREDYEFGLEHGCRHWLWHGKEIT